MTTNGAFKRKVRARMAETGEPYNVARRKILAEAEQREADNDPTTDSNAPGGTPS